MFLSYVLLTGNGNSHATFLSWLWGRKQAGGFHSTECQPLQSLCRSSALCCSVGSCQERGEMGEKEVWIIKQACPLIKKRLQNPKLPVCIYFCEHGFVPWVQVMLFLVYTTTGFLEHLPFAHTMIKLYRMNMCFSNLPAALRIWLF